MEQSTEQVIERRLRGVSRRIPGPFTIMVSVAAGMWLFALTALLAGILFMEQCAAGQARLRERLSEERSPEPVRASEQTSIEKAVQGAAP